MTTTHEALQTAIDRRTVEHARRLGLSSSTVHKWQEPHQDWTDSGAYNPLDRIEAIVETSISLGVSRQKALAPIHYLAQRFGLVVVNLPATDTNSSALSRDLLQIINEFSDLARSASTALDDNVVRRAEADDIEREGMELIRATAAFIRACRSAVQK